MSTLQTFFAPVDIFTPEDVALMTETGPSAEQLAADAEHDFPPVAVGRCPVCEKKRAPFKSGMCRDCWQAYAGFLEAYRVISKPTPRLPRIVRTPSLR
jgi:hypothetical protein